MREFERFHPAVIFFYYAFVIAFSCFYIHPVTLLISFIFANIFFGIVNGIGALWKKLRIMLVMMLATMLINPAFNHQGVTILTYLPSGNPLTGESVVFGIVAATMVISVIMHFMTFNEIFESDKLMYIFGRLLPSLSLIFSMTLRFLPRFSAQTRAVSDGQRCIGKISSGGLIGKIKSGMSVISTMVTWSFENSVDTAVSMKSRGYGTGRRTAFTTYTFTKRDARLLTVILILSCYIIVGRCMGVLEFNCFPYIKTAGISSYGMTVFAAYFILLSLPSGIELWNTRKVVRRLK